jgi:DNA-binding response OmpR family regulator
MKEYRVLLAEDDASLASGVVRGLREAGFSPDLVSSGRDVVPRALSGRYDLLILDLMLPELSGFEILTQLQHRARPPVIVLTARSELDDRLRSFALGAVDYLSKPFFIEELLARIRARLLMDATDARRTLQLPGLTLDLDARTVHAEGREVHLTRTELDLLAYLCARRGRALSRAQLSARVLPSAEQSDPRAVDAHMARLRKKLGAAGKLIESVWGIGYRLRAEPEP